MRRGQAPLRELQQAVLSPVSAEEQETLWDGNPGDTRELWKKHCG